MTEKMEDAVMATNNKLYFLIENCPGPFRLTAAWVHMLERHGNHAEFEFTVKPIEAGVEFLGHDRKFKIPFEVVLMGATTKYGHHVDEPRNVRMLGRFLIPGNIQPHFVDPSKAAPDLNEYQWEVVFNPGNPSVVGFVAKLSEPLPKEWSM